jgi:hypothetical protein
LNETYYLACIALFMAGAPLLLALRFAKPRRMPWWLLAVLAAALGWVLSNLAVHFYYQHLDDLIAESGGPNSAPKELLDAWQNDGAKRVFAYLFGWAYGLVYLMPWLVVYLLVNALRRSPDGSYRDI